MLCPTKLLVAAFTVLLVLLLFVFNQFAADHDHFVVVKNEKPRALVTTVVVERDMVDTPSQTCPSLDWWQFYVREHASGSKFLVYSIGTGGGGAGNRLRGIVSAFYLAVLTGRTFLIDWGFPGQLDDYFVPNSIDWRLALHDDVRVDGSAARLINVDYNAWHSGAMDAEFFATTDLNALVGQDRVVVMHSIYSFEEMLLANACNRADSLWSHEARRQLCGRTWTDAYWAPPFTCAFHFLFKPSNELRKAMLPMQKKLRGGGDNDNDDHDALVIGLHMRVAGDGVETRRYVPDAGVRAYADCALRVERDLLKPLANPATHRRVRWFLATDSKATLDSVTARFDDDSEHRQVLSLRAADHFNEVSGIHVGLEGTKEGTIAAFADMLLLAQTDVLVRNGHSSFASCAFLIGLSDAGRLRAHPLRRLPFVSYDSRTCTAEVRKLGSAIVAAPSLHRVDESEEEATGKRLNALSIDNVAAAQTFSNDEARLWAYVRSMMLAQCGTVCDTQDVGVRGTWMHYVHKDIRCDASLFATSLDLPATVWPPPKQMPEAFVDDYTMNGHVSTDSMYIRQRYAGAAGGTLGDWSEHSVSQDVALAREGLLNGTYGRRETNCLREQIIKHLENKELTVRDKHMVVLGSERPWVEALLLAYGASHVTTIEYGRIQSTHPHLSSLLPYEVAMRFLNGGGLRFDGAATFSSIEHSGLGRYGDPLNPWADLIAMARLWCIVKPGGPLYFGTMIGKHDHLSWNAHRRYAPNYDGLRFPQLMANWEQVSQGCGSQISFTFRRSNS